MLRLHVRRDLIYSRIHFTSTRTVIAIWFPDIEYGHGFREQQNVGARRPLTYDVLDLFSVVEGCRGSSAVITTTGI